MLPDVNKIAAMSSGSTSFTGDGSPLSASFWRPNSSIEMTFNRFVAKIDDSLWLVRMGVLPNSSLRFSSSPVHFPIGQIHINVKRNRVPEAVLGSLDTGLRIAQTPPAAAMDQNHSTLSKWLSKYVTTMSLCLSRPASRMRIAFC